MASPPLTSMESKLHLEWDPSAKALLFRIPINTAPSRFFCNRLRNGFLPWFLIIVRVQIGITEKNPKLQNGMWILKETSCWTDSSHFLLAAFPTKNRESKASMLQHRADVKCWTDQLHYILAKTESSSNTSDSAIETSEIKKKKKELAWCLGFGANILHVNCGLKRGAFGLAHQCNSCLTYSNCRHTTFRKKNQSLVSVLSDRKKKDLKQLALWKAFS